MFRISETILEDYQVRKTKKQKTRFIDYICNNFPEARVEQGGFIKNRNIIIGDVSTAKVIFSAHYDTCARLPFPNLIMPRNLIVTILYSLLITVPFLFVLVLSNVLIGMFTDNFLIMYYGSLLVFFALFIGVFFLGPPNKHTANDNTSGVVTLCEMMCSMTAQDREKCAFVFFDNEENGLLGSSYFRKIHKKEITDKLLVNLDCVGDGDHILIVENKPARESYGEALRASFGEEECKTLHFEKSSTTLYPSDQAGFPQSVALAALKRNRLFGLYMNRIHTNRDTVCDKSNIEYIRQSLLIFVRNA